MLTHGLQVVINSCRAFRRQTNFFKVPIRHCGRKLVEIAPNTHIISQETSNMSSFFKTEGNMSRLLLATIRVIIKKTSSLKADDASIINLYRIYRRQFLIDGRPGTIDGRGGNCSLKHCRLLRQISLVLLNIYV